MSTAVSAAASARTTGGSRLKNSLLHAALVPLAYLLPEVILFLLLRPHSLRPLLVGLLFAVVLGGICLALPPLVGRLLFAASFLASTVWGVAQYVYCTVFGKLMWLTDLFYASDGAIYFSTMMRNVSPAVWCCSVALLLFCIGLTVFWPRFSLPPLRRAALALLPAAAAAAVLCATLSGPMPDRTLDLYRVQGHYGLAAHDLWHNLLQPRLSPDRKTRARDMAEVDAYFAQRAPHSPNAMTAAFAGRDLVILLLEAFDDWMITPQETPALYELQQQSIRFTRFYSPYYGTTRSINTQTCIDTGVYFPTDGRYFYDYLSNSYDHSLAARFGEAGYTARLFHHNWPDFYRRSELVPALGYQSYHSYVVAAGGDETAAMNDQYLFDDPAMRQAFFREGPTVNFVATQAAHLPYRYDDPLSQYAFARYPQCKGAYSCEEEDCLRAKARLADDMAARLLQELEAEGRLENTVILVLSDHYPYGYQDKEQLMALAGNAADPLQLEQTPCFLWAADLQPADFDKTLQTADLLPTLLNLFDIPSPYPYPGQDAFDPAYSGFACFADGSWAADGVLCRSVQSGNSLQSHVLQNADQIALTPQMSEQKQAEARQFVRINNLLLSTDYYR